MESPNLQQRWLRVVLLSGVVLDSGLYVAKAKAVFSNVSQTGFPLVLYVTVSGGTMVYGIERENYKLQHVHALIILSKWFISSNLLESTRLYPRTNLFWSLPVLTQRTCSSPLLPTFVPRGWYFPESSSTWAWQQLWKWIQGYMDTFQLKPIWRMQPLPSSPPHTSHPSLILTAGKLSLSHNKLLAGCQFSQSNADLQP